MNQIASHRLSSSRRQIIPEDGTRPLTGELLRQVTRQFGGRDSLGLRTYSFRRRPSNFPDASADLDIYDGDGRLVFQGREFPNLIALWVATASEAKPSQDEAASMYMPPRLRLL